MKLDWFFGAMVAVLLVDRAVQAGIRWRNLRRRRKEGRD